MPRISGPSLERCGQVASAIDEELLKDPSDRKSLYIRTSKPRQFKNELSAYKTQVKPDWKGLFWMIVHNTHPLHGPCVEISFALEARRSGIFEIVREDEATIEVFKEDVGIVKKDTFTMTQAQSLTDDAAATYILVESPTHMKLDLSVLEKRTLDWVADSNTNDPSPLINLLAKRGYTIERRGSFLWVYRGES